MSSTHCVNIKCDCCSKEESSSSGSYCRPNWIKINIELIDYSNNRINYDSREYYDFCPDCLDKHGKNSLLEIAAKKAQK